MEFLIVTGLSGAGKTQAAHFLEDMGYYCVDNMPSALLQPFAEFCIASQGRFTKVALVTDVRAHESFEQLFIVCLIICVFAGIPCRVDPGCTVKGVDAEPGIVADPDKPGPCGEVCFNKCVFTEGLAVLDDLSLKPDVCER